MNDGKVCALMATYGRYSRVCESLACFLLQDWRERHLWILNNHPVPLYFDHPLVTLLNEGERHKTLGDCRNRLLRFADGEFLRTHDDDDLWMPWAFTQGSERIGEGQAWKPTRSWCYEGRGVSALADDATCWLVANAMEASINWRTEFVRRIGYRNGEGDEHLPLLASLGKDGLAQDEMGDWTGYCYRWGCGEWHASGSLGNGRSDVDRAADWKFHNDDVRPNTQLIPAFRTVLDWYRRLVHFVEPCLQTAWMAAALGTGPAHQSPHSPISKLLDLERLQNIPVKTAVVVGSFDLCTTAQIRLLEWAKGQADYLLAVIYDDFLATKREGPGRPFVPLAGRVASISMLDVVDAVVIHNGESMRQWLETLGPSALICEQKDNDESFHARFFDDGDVRNIVIEPFPKTDFRPEFEEILE